MCKHGRKQRPIKQKQATEKGDQINTDAWQPPHSYSRTRTEGRLLSPRDWVCACVLSPLCPYKCPDSQTEQNNLALSPSLRCGSAACPYFRFIFSLQLCDGSSRSPSSPPWTFPPGASSLLPTFSLWQPWPQAPQASKSIPDPWPLSLASSVISKCCRVCNPEKSP